MKSVSEIIEMLTKDIKKLHERLRKLNPSSPTYNDAKKLMERDIELKEESLQEWKDFLKKLEDSIM